MIGSDGRSFFKSINDSGGSFAGVAFHFSTPNSAESIRITPPLRAPCSLKTLAIRQANFTASRNFCCCSSVHGIQSPAVPGQTGQPKSLCQNHDQRLNLLFFSIRRHWHQDPDVDEKGNNQFRRIYDHLLQPSG